MLPNSRWYVAVLVFRSQVGEPGDTTPLLDCQVRVLRARDPESAYLSSLSLGEQAESGYGNQSGETVTWEFAGLHELSELLADEILDGTEVYSWMVRTPAEGMISAKADLEVFAALRNKDRTAEDMLGE
jgi:hypothetical protein